MSTLAPRSEATLLIVNDSGQRAPIADEQNLVERAREDINAFAELYNHFLPAVYAFAWRRTGSQEAAEDICSATFEQALRNLDRFQWRSGGFLPWLYRIASNQVITHYRKEARPSGARGQLAMARMHQTATDADIDHLFSDDAQQLRSALDSLRPRYQRAISLRYLADMSTEEAAAAMGLGKKPFAVVLSRAMKALRKELDERGT